MSCIDELITAHNALSGQGRELNLGVLDARGDHMWLRNSGQLLVLDEDGAEVALTVGRGFELIRANGPGECGGEACRL